MNIVFLGTPAFAVPSLHALCAAGFTVSAVISQPDREKDKKGRLLPTPVKAEAEALGLPCYQFDKVSVDGLALLRDLQPDLIVTAAFGQLLTQDVLQVPRLGVWNVHASLLPKYRGSSPIQNAIRDGETETGVTIMQTERSMDTGDILNVAKTPIYAHDTLLSLSDRLACIGANLLVDTIKQAEQGTLQRVKQQHELATYTKKIVKADGLIHWTDAAEKIFHQVRAMNPWPAAFTYFKGQNIKIYESEICPLSADVPPGTILESSAKEGLTVACGKDALRILALQAPTKKVLPACEFLKGYSMQAGEHFSSGDNNL